MRHFNLLIMAVVIYLFVAPGYGAERVAPSKMEDPKLSWWSAIGTHYRLDNDNWLGVVRGWPGQYSIGYHPDVTNHDHEGIDPVIGRFSGEERYYSYAGGRTINTETRVLKKGQVAEDQAETAYDPTAYETIISEETIPDYDRYLRQAMEKRTDIIQLVLGNIKPSRREWEVFNPNDGLYFKDAVYNTVVHANSGEFAEKPITIYWQLGNEVNAYTRFHMKEIEEAESLDWMMKKIIPNNNPVNAADYVEYYLAPAVEAIRAASEDLYGDSREIKIVCASVSGMTKEDSQHFLDVLLNSVVRGERAPTLAGKQAWELVDSISIHYLACRHDILGPLFEKWVKSGRVDGIWITEELGARGAGPYAVAQATFRFLDFWSQHPKYWHPDNSRLTIWGDMRNHPRSVGTGIEAEEIIGRFLRDYPLTRAKDEVIVASNGSMEWYALRANESEEIVRYAVYAAAINGHKPKLRQIRLPMPSGGKPENLVSVKVNVIDSADGIFTLEPEIHFHNKQAIIIFEYELPVTAALVLEAIVK